MCDYTTQQRSVSSVGGIGPQIDFQQALQSHVNGCDVIHKWVNGNFVLENLLGASCGCVAVVVLPHDAHGGSMGLPDIH